MILISVFVFSLAFFINIKKLFIYTIEFYYSAVGADLEFIWNSFIKQ